VKVVRVDVAKSSISYEVIDENSKFYRVGGRALTSLVVAEEVPPNCDSLGPENKLIISAGLITGGSAACSARTSVGAKSALTGGIKEANTGGNTAMLLARQGIRAIIFEGTSNELKILLVKEGEAKLEPANFLKGKGTYETVTILKEKYGNKIGIYSIGPAGELKMKAATVSSLDLQGYPSRHAARGGLGAILGTKGIKAVVIFPTEKNLVEILNPEAFKEHATPFSKYLAESRVKFSTYGTAMTVDIVNELNGLPTKNYRIGRFDKAQNISGQKLVELIQERGGKNRLACSPTCTIRCSNLFVDKDGNHITSSLEYETIAMNGSNLMIGDLDEIAQIDHLCDDVGVDTIEFGVTMGVTMDAGKIEWGDANAVKEILDKEIRKGTEKGVLYGNGVVYTAKSIGVTRIPQVKGQALSAYDPRVFKAMAVTFATSPMGADHTAGAAIYGRKAYSNKDYGDIDESRMKIDLSTELQIFTAVMDSIGCCYFIGPSWRNMEYVANLLNAMHGWNMSAEDVMNWGKEIINMEIEFNKKAGLAEDTNDLPEFFRTEPLEPTGSKFDINKEELASVWKNL
jgi:aldehyde:ferredoxin oxidoreductase